MNFRKFLLASVFVVTIPALVFAQTVTLSPQINNPQSNTLDNSNNNPTNTLDQNVQNDQTQTAASQNQTSGEQTATYNEDNSVVNPPAEPNGGDPYVGDQEQATNENEFAYQDQDFGNPKGKNDQDADNEQSPCSRGGCEQDNYAYNTINQYVDVLSNNTAATFQGNALAVFGFYQGGRGPSLDIADADAGAYSSANAAAFSHKM